MDFRYRINNNQRAHFLKLSVVNEIDLFKENQYKLVVIESLRFCQEKKGLRIFGWCLMPDALFIIAQAAKGRDLSNIIRDFKTYTSKAITRLATNDKSERGEFLIKVFQKAAVKTRKKIDHKVWLEGFYPVEMYSPGFISQKLFEIHGFPVDKGLVYEKTDYEFSSARNYHEMPSILTIESISDPISNM